MRHVSSYVVRRGKLPQRADSSCRFDLLGILQKTKNILASEYWRLTTWLIVRSAYIAIPVVIAIPVAVVIPVVIAITIAVAVVIPVVIAITIAVAVVIAITIAVAIVIPVPVAIGICVCIAISIDGNHKRQVYLRANGGEHLDRANANHQRNPHNDCGAHPPALLKQPFRAIVAGHGFSLLHFTLCSAV